jgi:hypothetical protein
MPLFGELMFFYVGYALRFGWTFQSTTRNRLGVEPSICATIYNPASKRILPVEGALFEGWQARRLEKRSSHGNVSDALYVGRTKTKVARRSLTEYQNDRL